ncbi:uncharacterized protein LOC113279256 [Papaver somniferum]|uniref:uncharacterized protein LOC113279256 n=1 Tax=Papaver somniferum TaxID=3469 RepID=UPI000E705965|nr:uncharacterized protein LOC113279256 [Papaver somniferum]
MPWKLPDSGYQKLNFDAVFVKENNYMGIGLILFNDASQCGGAQSIHGIAQAEALATLAAIKWAKAEAVENLHLECDCLNIVKAINDSIGSVIWTNNNVIQDCRTLLGSFTSWRFTFVYRKSNEVANSLSRRARNSKLDEFWATTFPGWLKSLIRDRTQR